ncbi:MAG: hypothetical protein K6C10_08240 [Prevotella sp.]|nr:hypothetical protein [Prevotella sp.]
MNNELEIRTLAEKFFDGTTTLAEEERLYELFGRAESLPADLESLREMMLDMAALSKISETTAQLQPCPTDDRERSDETEKTALHPASSNLRGASSWTWVSLAASLLLLFTLGSLWYGHERQNECVAYVYGERITDEVLVMQEMQTAMASIADDEATSTMEQQMKDFFSE